MTSLRASFVVPQAMLASIGQLGVHTHTHKHTHTHTHTHTHRHTHRERGVLTYLSRRCCTSSQASRREGSVYMRKRIRRPHARLLVSCFSRLGLDFPLKPAEHTHTHNHTHTHTPHTHTHTHTHTALH